MSGSFTMESIEQRVFLLAIYTAQEGETIKDSMNSMINSGVFDKKEGKQCIKNLKELKFITDDGITMMGIELAKVIESEFKV